MNRKGAYKLLAVVVMFVICLLRIRLALSEVPGGKHAVILTIRENTMKGTIIELSCSDTHSILDIDLIHCRSGSSRWK